MRFVWSVMLCCLSNFGFGQTANGLRRQEKTEKLSEVEVESRGSGSAASFTCHKSKAKKTMRFILAPLLLGRASAQITRTCSFVHTEVEEIYVEDVSGAGASRKLGGEQIYYTKAYVKIANAMNDSVDHRSLSISGEWSNSTSSPNLVPFKGLYCDCTSRLATRSEFYCPVTSKSCEVWRGLNGGDDYSVSCTSENWMVAYARYVCDHV